MTISIFDRLVGGEALSEETLGGVPFSEDGVFSVIIRADARTYAGRDRYLQVEIDGELLEPRIPFNSVAYSLRSQEAELAVDAARVGGRTAAELDQSAHVARSDNPHGVTAAQAGAATPAGVSGAIAAHTALPGAHHTKTSTFGELSGQVADGQIPSTITRDNEVFPTVRANDGPGSDLNADRLDGLHGSSFLRTTGGTISGSLVVSNDVTVSDDLLARDILTLEPGFWMAVPEPSLAALGIDAMATLAALARRARKGS